MSLDVCPDACPDVWPAKDVPPGRGGSRAEEGLGQGRGVPGVPGAEGTTIEVRAAPHSTLHPIPCTASLSLPQAALHNAQHEAVAVQVAITLHPTPYTPHHAVGPVVLHAFMSSCLVPLLYNSVPEHRVQIVTKPL